MKNITGKKVERCEGERERGGREREKMEGRTKRERAKVKNG